MVSKNNNLFVLFILLFFCVNTNIIAQRKISVHVEGTSISRDKTPKEALKEAIENAQTNALREAGITEQISVSTTLFQESSEDDFNNYFNEISSRESNANIVTDSIYLEKRSFDVYGNMIVTVKIDATVFKYNTKKDPSLFFNVEGLKDVYYENQSISFSFTPSQDGYLKIFVLNENEALVLYPYENKIQEYLSDLKNKQFKRSEKVIFPIHDAYKPGYSIELEGDEGDENSVLIFVFTKDNIAWIENKISIKTILNWIYNIPINQREVKFENVLLKMD